MAPLTSFAGVEFAGVEELPNDYFKALIHGPQGTGKSSLAATIAMLGPCLFLDLTGEHGVRSFKGAPFSKNIKVIRPPNIKVIDDIYWELAAGDHPFKSVVVDSVTSVQRMAMRFLMGHDETAIREIGKDGDTASFHTWGQTGNVMTDLATFWFGLADGHREKPMHVVMTAQTKLKEDDEGDMIFTPDVQPAALSILLANPDYVLYTDMEENPDALGDGDEPQLRHIVRFGADPKYRTKARVPYNKRGKVPPILGRTRATNFLDLGRVMEIGGIPARKKKAPAKAAPAAKAIDAAKPAAESKTPTKAADKTAAKTSEEK